MKVLVCGGKEFDNLNKAFNVMTELSESDKITHVIEGGSMGADYFVRLWAQAWDVQYTSYEADLENDGEKAVSIRNAKILSKNSDIQLVVVFPDDSEDTKDIVSKLKQKNVKIVNVD